MSRKIFQRKEYSIYRCSDGFVVHNTNKKFENGHTHVNNFYKVRKKLPNTSRKWEIESLIRGVKDKEYKKQLINLLLELK